MLPGWWKTGWSSVLGPAQRPTMRWNRLSALIDEGLRIRGPDLVPDEMLARQLRIPLTTLDTYPGWTLPSMGQTRSIPPSA